MIHSVRGTRGMAVTPHALASQSALAVLREGGNAIEAAIAAAATIAVVYPHMNSIGGDSFWLLHVPGKAPGVIEACGAAAGAASLDWYHARGITHSIPFAGGPAANTVAGTIAGWGTAFKLSRSIGGRLPLKRLLEDAIHYAERGYPVTRGQALATADKRMALQDQPGFAATFLHGNAVPETGSLFVHTRLAATLRRLARAGTEDFYRGDLARVIARELQRADSPLTLADLERHQSVLRNPLALAHSAGTVFNAPPPTQGLMSLVMLGILDQLRVQQYAPTSAEYVHFAAEAIKQAFRIRDAHVTDPAWMKVDPREFLRPQKLRELAANIDPRRAAPWGAGRIGGDTVWMGVVDGAGRAVSIIQSTYHEFGSGIVLGNTGINWQNRGCAFSLDPANINAVAPGKKPFHTLNPAMARLKDGRVMVYGSMGGDGQPQAQNAVFTRMIGHGLSAQEAVSAPRWLLGRTWGQTSDTLKLESRFPLSVAEKLGGMGHEVEILQAWDTTVGHAGAILRHPDGVLEGGADPRSDGLVAAF